MAEKNINPEVRFKGFNDYWKVKNAKFLCSIGTGKNNTQDKVSGGKYPFYVRSATIEGSNQYIFNEEAVLTVGDGVGTGKIYHYINGKYDLHQRVYRMFDFKELLGKYFFYFFSNNFQKRVLAMTAKSSVDSVRLEMISKMDIIYPNLIEEQNGIISFFENLDNIITQHQKKHNKLIILKKAMLGKMFPKDGSLVPEIRFKGFTKNWEEKLFGEFALVKRGLTYSPNNVSYKGVKVLRSSNIYEDTFVENKDDVYVNEEAINIQFAQENDILITSANGSSRLVGKHALLKNLKVKAVHGGFMLIARSKQPYFLNASMSSSWYQKFINKNVSGGNGAIGNLKSSDFGEQVILIPKEDEQIKIGNYFQNIDKQISLHQIKLKKLKNMKKACFSKMFVSQD